MHNENIIYLPQLTIIIMDCCKSFSKYMVEQSSLWWDKFTVNYVSESFL